MTMRFCEKSRGKGSIFRHLIEEFPEVDVKIVSCIKLCSLCETSAVASVDNKRVIGKDFDEIYSKLLKLLNKI